MKQRRLVTDIGYGALFVLILGWLFVVSGKISYIEGSRFTREQGSQLHVVISEIRASIATLVSEVSELKGRKIPPAKVDWRLDQIEKRLDTLAILLNDLRNDVHKVMKWQKPPEP